MNSPAVEPVSARGIAVILLILIFLVLLTFYANVQKFRRDKIETVIVTTLATPTPSPSP
jgi:hypothetical protein